MGSIVLLDEHTINKIAAGEVVDRPSSIVKELIENSIDAGATSVSIEIKNGGIKYIKVTDNGKGFTSDDIELAFERHATSKIRKEEDLLKITSMGFRGEALASIAAISKVSLITMNKDEMVGMRAEVEGGNILSIQQYPSTVGTKIEIRDVFYNVPARFKFLKKDYTEAGYIEDVVSRAAMANPNVSFKYINNGKVIIQTRGNGDLKSTIYDIFGKDIYDNVIEISGNMNDIEITGMIGLPSISRSTRMHQYTFINKRYIKDKTLNSAIDKACEQKYAINKYPFIILNIGINPSHIDVNVHPAKLEVKFDDENRVFQAVYSIVRETIEYNNKKTSPFTQALIINELQTINTISKDIKNNGITQSYADMAPKKFDFNIASKVYEEKNNKNDQETLNFNEKSENSNSIEINENTIAEDKIQEYTTVSDNNLDNKIIPDKMDNDINFSNNFKFDNVAVEKYDEIDIIPKEQVKPYIYIGNVFNTYIIIQIMDKMYIIDQHAAHERLLFEKFKTEYYAKEKQTQILLVPILVELTPKEKNIVDENTEMFENAGFIIEQFGENSIKISGVPNIGYQIEYESMFKDMIDDLLGDSKTEQKEKEFRFIATLACKAAVKGRMKLDVEEQITLIDNMIQLENPFTCPHGRPTAYEISKYEIERKFLRK